MNRMEDSATKADIAGLKNEICGLGTRLDAKIQAVDAKLDASTKRLALGIDRADARMDSCEHRMTKAVTDNADRILTALDRYSKVVEADNRGMPLHGSILTEVQLRLQEHDQRIVRLETSGANPAPNP